MKKSFVIVSLLVCILSWYSCTKDKAIVQSSGACDSTQVTYSNTILRIMENHCTNSGGCHSTSLGLGTDANPLETIYQVKAEDPTDTTGNTSIVCRLKAGCGTDQMPKGLRPLPRAYIDTFLLWQANNYCQ